MKRILLVALLIACSGTARGQVQGAMSFVGISDCTGAGRSTTPDGNVTDGRFAVGLAAPAEIRRIQLSMANGGPLIGDTEDMSKPGLAVSTYWNGPIANAPPDNRVAFIPVTQAFFFCGNALASDTFSEGKQFTATITFASGGTLVTSATVPPLPVPPPPDTTPPTVALTLPKPNADGSPSVVWGTTPLRWESNDPESPVGIKLWIDDQPVGDWWWSSQTVWWPTTIHTPGLHAVKVEAVNGYDLRTTATMSVRIEQPTTTAIPGPPGPAGPAGPPGQAVVFDLVDTQIIRVTSQPIQLLKAPTAPGRLYIGSVTLTPKNYTATLLLVRGKGTGCLVDRGELDFTVTRGPGIDYKYGPRPPLGENEGLCVLSNSGGEAELNAQVIWTIIR
jgi:hypothetical protein